MPLKYPVHYLDIPHKTDPKIVMQRIMNNHIKFFAPFISLNNKAMKSVTMEGQQFVIGNVIV